MSDASPDDMRLIQERLDRAFDEAWSKVNIALEFVNGSGDPRKSLWYAAEAVEYACFLYNLRHGLEDFDPQLKARRKEDLQVLVKDSVELLRRARELQQGSITEAYTSLRMAADNLKTAYLARLKHASKSPR